jgi:hypothetical protein
LAWLVWLAGAPGRFGVVATGLSALAWRQWLAAGLDAVENCALTLMLLNAPVEPWPQVAFWCAAAKFTLIVAGPFAALLALVYLLIRTLR